jgi:hypothetical protein
VRNHEDGDFVVAGRKRTGEIRRDAPLVVAKGIGLVGIVDGNWIGPPYQDQIAERRRFGFAGYLEGNALRRSLAGRGFSDQDLQRVFAWRQDEEISSPPFAPSWW